MIHNYRYINIVSTNEQIQMLLFLYYICVASYQHYNLLFNSVTGLYVYHLLLACKMSTRLQPWYECNDTQLTVMWPTDDVFPEDTKIVPDVYKTPIVKLLKIPPVFSLELTIVSHHPL